MLFDKNYKSVPHQCAQILFEIFAEIKSSKSLKSSA